jgi:chromosome segregation ATPase
MTDELAEQLQGKDHEFGRHVLGLLVRHESILKAQGAALAAVEDLKQDLSREREEKEGLVLEQLETRNNNATLVKEKTAAALLAKDKAAEMAWVKKERDEAKNTLLDVNSQLKEALKREASLLEREKEREKESEREKTVEKQATAAATKREKEAKDITIKGLEKRLAEEERQHNLAVKNADASRHSRNEAQDALAAIQADKDQLTRELEMMTANHENVAIDLEQTRASLKRAQADSAQLIDVKAELVTVRSELQRLSSANAQLSASAEAIEDLEKKLENMRMWRRTTLMIRIKWKLGFVTPGQKR